MHSNFSTMKGSPRRDEASRSVPNGKCNILKEKIGRLKEEDQEFKDHLGYIKSYLGMRWGSEITIL